MTHVRGPRLESSCGGEERYRGHYAASVRSSTSATVTVATPPHDHDGPRPPADLRASPSAANLDRSPDAVDRASAYSSPFRGCGLAGVASAPVVTRRSEPGLGPCPSEVLPRGARCCAGLNRAITVLARSSSDSI